MTRHRPTFVLFVAQRPPIATCTCHYGQPIRFDRPLPKCAPVSSERAA